MKEKKVYILPEPMLDAKEEEQFEIFTEKYEKLTKPGALAKVKGKASELVPDKIKDGVSALGEGITEKEFYVQAMKVATHGYKALQENAAKYTISEKQIINSINKKDKKNNIENIDEICLARVYDIKRLVSNLKFRNLGGAAIEGGATGFVGFAALPVNFVVSIFMYFRAVQAVALHYGYDVRRNPDELEHAALVLTNALSPNENPLTEAGELISKVMVQAELAAIKQTAAKTWTDMAKEGGVRLLIAQIRALTNAAAQKALQNAGKKGLEESVFTTVLEQVSRKLTLKSVGKDVPIFGALFGALFDAGQMNKILEYADIYYGKRFIAEKEIRINQLFDKGVEDRNIIDVEFSEVEPELVISKIVITSNNICYGPEPKPDDEVEQRLTVSSSGWVYFTAYQYAEGFGKYKASRKFKSKLGVGSVSQILELLTNYYRERHNQGTFATDIGEWSASYEYENGETFKDNGSLMSDAMVYEGIEISEKIREIIPVDNLWVFDGNPE